MAPGVFQRLTREWRRLASDEPDIAALVEEYVARLAAGERLTRSAFLAEHPEVAAALAPALEAVRGAPEPVASVARHSTTELPSVGIPHALSSGLGRFEILSELGHGAMGRVYQARDRRTGEDVALKTLHVGMEVNDVMLKRLAREANGATVLRHPHIVSVLGFEEDHGVPLLIMELVPGGRTLKGLISATGRLPEARAISIARDLARALDFAHRHDVIHRDVKPTNVLLQGLTPRLTDFGLAYVKNAQLSRLTKSGEMVGTLVYMSPEQALGEAKPDPRWDIYALGATLYECLTGVPPFAADSAPTILRQIMHEDPVPPRQHQVELSLGAEAILIKCLEKNPDHRYQSAVSLAEDLDRLMRGQVVQAPRINWRWRRFAHGVARHRLLLVALVALLAGGVLAGWQLTRMQYREQLNTLLETQGAAPPGSADFGPTFLLQAVHEPRAEVRVAAVAALQRARGPREDQALLAAAHDADKRVRFQLAQGPWLPGRSVGRDVLAVLLQDPEPPVVAAAAGAALRLGDAALLPAVQALASHPDRTVRELVLTNLLASAQVDLPHFLDDYLRHGPAAGRLALLERLARRSAPPPIPALIARLTAADSSDEERLKVVQCLRLFTGQAAGSDAAAWQAWWDAQGATWAVRRAWVVQWNSGSAPVATGALIWTLDQRPPPLAQSGAPPNTLEMQVLVDDHFVPLPAHLEAVKVVDFYLGLQAGLPVGEGPQILALRAALAGAAPAPAAPPGI